MHKTSEWLQSFSSNKESTYELDRSSIDGCTKIAVTGGKGGVGKSQVAANLAIAIAMDVNHSVLLVDMDLVYPKIDWCFNLNNQ